MSIVLACPRPTRAAPDDGFALSDDAALMGGAVVASGRDVASSWYNPALLTHNDRLRADVSATAYGLRFIRAPRGLQLTDDDRRRVSPIRGREFLVVPTAFAIGSAVGSRVSLGFGFFTSRFSEPSLVVRGGIDASDPFAAEVRRSGVNRRYHAGPLLGIRVNPDFDIGFALYGVYDKSSDSQRVFLERSDDGGRSTILSDADTNVRSYGLQGAFGLKGNLSKRVSAGASVFTPAVVMFQRVEGSSATLESVTDASGVSTSTSDFEGYPIQRWPTRVSTWKVASGVAIGERRWKVGLDAEASPPHGPNFGPLGRTAHWNVRMGFRMGANRRWSFGGGVFTDRNDSRATSIGSVRVDLYGIAAGVRLRTPVRLGKRERENEIAFRTTVGVSYAGGRGRASGFEAVYGGDVAPLRIDYGTSVGATMHLLTVYVGSGLAF